MIRVSEKEEKCEPVKITRAGKANESIRSTKTREYWITVLIISEKTVRMGPKNEFSRI